MRCYVIYANNNGNNCVVSLEEKKSAVENYVNNGMLYTHWDTDISGDFPMITNMHVENPEYWTDTRTYQEKRRCAYRMEADVLKLESDGCDDDGDNPNQKKAAWRAKRTEIKLKYPSS